VKKIKILIADDHRLVRDGIKAMFTHVNDFEVVGEAKNGNEVIDRTVKLKPDIIIMDISMPGISGIDATKTIMKRAPKTKILVLTQHENDEYVYQVFESGGSGYLLKNTKKEDFILAIRTVMKGEKYYSKKISALLMQKFLNNDDDKRQRKASNTEIHLTQREKEIIKLIANELGNQEIADSLFISLRTVETHRRNIMQKLNVKNAVALLNYALQNGIITMPGKE